MDRLAQSARHIETNKTRNWNRGQARILAKNCTINLHLCTTRLTWAGQIEPLPRLWLPAEEHRSHRAPGRQLDQLSHATLHHGGIGDAQICFILHTSAA
jgi:hypothetical protein